MVRLTVVGQTLPFMVDTGAEHSVVTTAIAPPLGREISIVRATGQLSGLKSFCQARTVELGGHQVRHEFLYLPECPVPLLGQDLLAKLGAQISFQPLGEAHLRVSTPSLVAVLIPRGEEYRLYEGPEGNMEEPATDERVTSLRTRYPQVWAEDNPPGLATNHAPLIIDMKPGAGPRQICQYPIPWQARLGITEVIQKHLREGILVSCQSPWNTPLLPVKKPDGMGYRPSQHLRAVNEATVTLHPVVPNPYTLLSQLPPESAWFTCLDLKDTFFCL